MATLLILTAALLLVLLVVVSWRAHARALQDARRLEAEGARGREIEGIAMDAASLLAATLQLLETARVAGADAPRESRTAVENAAKAANALATLFHAARLYLSTQDSAIAHGSAEGCVRVAIAIARSRGCGVSVRGEHTVLPFHGRASDACAVLLDALGACRSTLASSEFVEVVLDEVEVRVLCGTAREVALDASAGVHVGWSIDRAEWEGRPAIIIRARASEADDQGGSLIAAPATGLMH